MEPENIDWSNIESVFEEDSAYENINAPKWIDLSAPPEPVDDDTWFCKTRAFQFLNDPLFDCKHPKIFEDILKPTRNFKVKFLRSRTISEILPFRERRNVKQKEKEINVSSAETPSMETKATKSSYKSNEDNENLNPNLTIPTFKLQGKQGGEETKRGFTWQSIATREETTGAKEYFFGA
ncbi:hypothetical protein Patl1_20569 [Pistacia atlantica]|uniref:Uncharacterized protein n=1 Tax=Pistacia atlantica TaxID=434234 RepID=A0ACC1BI56_9ROSI|nr:hypothetical protein Patl1_20569 [Pistacia atlantica]